MSLRERARENTKRNWTARDGCGIVKLASKLRPDEIVDLYEALDDVELQHASIIREAPPEWGLTRSIVESHRLGKCSCR